MSCRYAFNVRQHWWFDAGLAGLYYTALQVKTKDPSYYKSVEINVESASITFTAETEDEIKKILEACYTDLANRYWNRSSKKQKESKELVRFNRNTQELELIPKRNPTPIPALFTGARSWRVEGIAYQDMPTIMKQNVDAFLQANKRSLWGTKKLLVYEPPVCHQEVELFPIKGKKTICCVCGQEQVGNVVSQPSFLLFASPSATLSFNSQIKRPDNICWECQFISKFAVESALYKESNDNLYILQLATNNMEKLINSQMVLGSQAAVKQFDEEYFSANIGTVKSDNRLLFYAKLPYELLWAFFHDTYNLIRNDIEERYGYDEEIISFSCLQPVISSPLQVILLHIASKGQTFLMKDMLIYSDVVYAFRLIQEFKQIFVNDHKFLFKVFQDLYMPVKSSIFDINNYLWRNRILQKVLQKKNILQDIEYFCFHKATISGENPYYGNLLEFVKHYYIKIGGGDIMNKEQIEVAINLGKQIVRSAKESNSFDRVKGDLFALRKTRTVTDFLEQLNRIQFRYNLIISNQLLEGLLNDPKVSFADFKSYCLLSSLNTYNILKRPQTEN